MDIVERRSSLRLATLILVPMAAMFSLCLWHEFAFEEQISSIGRQLDALQVGADNLASLQGATIVRIDTLRLKEMDEQATAGGAVPDGRGAKASNASDPAVFGNGNTGAVPDRR